LASGAKTSRAATRAEQGPVRAQWLWYNVDQEDNVNVYMLARKTFRLKSLPRSALIYITADHRYRLYVNNRYVTRGPARGIPSCYPYDTVEVAPYLRRGKNVFAVRVYQVGVGTFQSLPSGAAGLLVESADGKLPVDSGPDWRVKRDEAVAQFVDRVSVQLGHQEHFDARKEEANWRSVSFDDSDWLRPACRGHGTFPPFLKLEPRAIPQMREEIVKPVKIIACFKGRGGRDYRNPKNITVSYLAGRYSAAAPAEVYDGSASRPTVRRTGRGAAKGIVIDFGRTVTGSVMLKAQGAGGEIIELLYTEVVDRKGRPVIADPTQGCRVAMADRFILREGRQRLEVFQYRGFRYLTVVVHDAPRELVIDSLALRRVEYPVEPRGRFSSSEPLLDRIYEVGAWTQRNCMFDAYVDCPWREQAQWWGDARVQARVALTAFGDTALLARGIRQAAQTQLPDGVTYGHFPTVAYFCILPDFTLTWIMTVWDYYRATGDARFVRELWPNVKKAVEWFKCRTTELGLLGPEPDYWFFLDWADLYKDGHSAVYNMLYLETLRAAAELAAIAREKADAARYARKARKVERLIRSYFFDDARKIWRDGVDLKGKPLKKVSVHANALAVLLELNKGADESVFSKGILPALEGREGVADASPFFYVRVLDAMKTMGLYEAAMDVIRRRWGKMLEDGATTFFEHWHPAPGLESRCHAWAASPVFYISEIVLGVESLAPGWRRVRIAPKPCGLEWAEGTAATPRGDIDVRWERKGSHIHVRARVPEGVRAELIAGNKKHIVGPGEHRLAGVLR